MADDHDAKETRNQDAVVELNPSTREGSWLGLLAFTTWEHVPVLVCAMSTSLADAVVTPVSTIFVGRIFQGFTDLGGSTITEPDFRYVIATNVLVLTGLAGAGWLLSSSFFSMWIRFGELQARAARLQLFEGLLAKPVTFYDTLPTGIHALSPRTQTQIRELQLATSQPLGSALQLIGSALASLIIAFHYSWSLALLLLATLPLSGLFLAYISGRMQKHVDNQVAQLALAAKHASTAFANIETVKCFNGQVVEYRRFLAPIEKALQFYMQQVRGNALQMGYIKFATLVTFMGGFYYGSHIVMTRKASTADVITTFFSCLAVTQAIHGILSQMIVLEKGRAAGSVLRDLVELYTSEDRHLESFVIPKEFPGEITFRQVSFAYPTRPENLALEGVSCSFAMGEITFIIGHSGSGKSTLSQLLLRFYEPHLGDIFFDDTPLSAIDPEWLRGHITLVEQQSALFDDTLFENIAIGNQDLQRVTIEDVRKAAEFALLTRTINAMPQGLDTVVGANGNALSGGQRQRVALARARLRDTPILILDESTSALDQTSKSLVMSAIRRWRQNKTTIVITHDISLINSTEQVIHFEDGRIVAFGTRAKLEEEKSLLSQPNLPNPNDWERQRKAKVQSSPQERHSRTFHTRRLSLSSSSFENESGELRALDASASLARRRRFSFLPTAYCEMSVQDPGVLSPGSRVRTFETSMSSSAFYQETSFILSPSDTDFNRPPLPSPPRPELTQAEKSELTHPTAFESSRLDIIEMQMLQGSGMKVLQNRNVRDAWRRRELEEVERASLESYSDPQDALLHKRLVSRTREQWDPKPSLRTIVRTIWPALDQKTRSILVLCLICILVHSASVPLFSWLFSKILETFYAEEDAAEMALKWSMVMLALSVVDGVTTYVLHVGLEYCSQVWVDRTRLQAMEGILDQPKHFFAEEGNTTANLVYNLDRNAEEMRNLLGRFLAFFVVGFTMLIIGLTWSLLVCWRLTLVGFALTPLSWIMMQVFHIVSSKLERQSNDAAEASARVLSETLGNVKIVRAWKLESLFRSKHAKLTQRTFNVGVSRSLYSGLFFGISESSLLFINCLVYYYGSLLAGSGECSVQEVLLVFSQLIFALSNVTTIVGLIPQVASSKDTAMRLLSLAHLPQDSHEHHGTSKPTSVDRIRFDEVSFSYSSRPQDNILRDVSLTFDKGTSTAIVGPSGSGKSTIISLLVRLYPLPPSNSTSRSTANSITINNTDIRSISTATLRNLITIVPQTPVLFPGTISQNICYAAPASSPSHATSSIRAAAAAAGIHDFIASLPAGYDTLIGDGGTGLSGGQAQRIAIARALVRRPQCLVLDECTAALDAAGAALVRETVRGLMRARPEMIMVAVTHEREMMELADRVVMVEGGRVVEVGAFGELVAAGGRFSAFVGGGVWPSG